MTTYFDFLPDELIYIIFNYGSYNLIKLSNKYEKIYCKYIDDIYNGNLFNFELIKAPNVRLKHYFSDKTYGCYKMHLSTSEYYNKIHSQISVLYPYERPNNPFKDIYDFRNLENLLIYADQFKTSGLTRMIVIYKNNNNYILKIKVCSFGNVNSYESTVWKQIWNQLKIDDQNSLLHQHSFFR